MVRNAFPSKNEKNTTCADHFWTFRYCFAWEARRIVHRVTKTRERGRLVDFVAFQKTMAGAGRLKRNRKVMRRQVPAAAAAMLHMLANPAQAPPNIQAAHSARQTIQEHGWDAPTWHQLVELRPPTQHGSLVAGPIQPEWQQQAATLSTTQHAQGCTTSWTQQAKPCLTHTPGPSPAEPSQQSYITQRPPTQTTSFASSCFADSGFHCPSPNDPVGAVAFLTHMATTVQPALGQGCGEAEQCHWNMPPHGCAEKLATGSQCTRSWPTSTSQQSSGLTTDP